MKKVKIILTAITVFTVVGGTLAFKANNRTGSTILYTKGGGSTCTVQLVTFTTSNSNNGTAISATTVDDAACSTFYTRSTEF
ncbi:hypothetical protein FAM09_22340 [Niastella caeni]|uniref:Uncharacterized protein n=1 Tax=Niastella caeni TaxID=2569763 RepID=A0A4S8HHN7_9BACT|nr:hypothetical protein [Niastella caeni]THU34740.1 hypothetical protein FAM09_22340 [Niastella caeni]